MKTFVEISMLTWETAAAGTDGETRTDGLAQRFAPGIDAPVPSSMDCSVRSDMDWIREHEGFAASLVSLGVPHA